MGRSLQNVNKRYAGGARPLVNDVPVTDGNGKLMGYLSTSTIATATAVTLTPAQVLGGLILQDPAGGAVTTTLPTAELLLAEVLNNESVKAGTSVEFTIRNTADAAEAITVAAGTGGSTSGTMTIAQNNTKRFVLVFTNTTSGSAAYTVYSLGTVVH